MQDKPDFSEKDVTVSFMLETYFNNANLFPEITEDHKHFQTEVLKHAKRMEDDLHENKTEIEERDFNIRKAFVESTGMGVDKNSNCNNVIIAFFQGTVDKNKEHYERIKELEEIIFDCPTCYPKAIGENG